MIALQVDRRDLQLQRNRQRLPVLLVNPDRPLQESLRDIRPAATCVVCGLVDPRMKIEIEVTARKAR